MENLKIAKYARCGFWTTDNILEMIDEDCHSFANANFSISWPSDNGFDPDWKYADWLIGNGTEDLRFFSYHVVLFRRCQYSADISLTLAIRNHVEAGTLAAKDHVNGNRMFKPHEFKSWWFKYDMKTYVKELGLAPSSPLYEVFAEMEKIDKTNQNSPLEESAGKVAKTEKANKDKIQDSPPRPTAQFLVDTALESVTEKTTKILSLDTAKKPAGVKAPYLKQPVIDEAIRIRKEKGITSAPKIARLSKITKILAPSASHIELKGIKDDEYKKRFGRKPGTVEDWIREGFKENLSS